MGPSHRRSQSAARLQAVTAPLTQAASGEASDARRVKKCRDCDQLETSRGCIKIPADHNQCGENLGNDDHDDYDDDDEDEDVEDLRKMRWRRVMLRKMRWRMMM